MLRPHETIRRLFNSAERQDAGDDHDVAMGFEAEFGRGFSKRSLHYMARFAEIFPDVEIVHALRSQLSWTHFRELIAIDDPLERQFYTELCRVER